LLERNSFQIFLAVQRALFLRELSMRFSMSKTGVFWTFFEPFTQVMVMVLIKILLFGRENDNFDFAVFLALNFTAFNLFKNILMKSMGAFSANKALFIYKQVKPIDTIVARVMIELFITSIIILFFLAIGVYWNYDLEVKNLPMLTLGFVFLILFSFSWAVFLSVINTFYSSVSKTISLLMTFLMFSSALFYTIEMLPFKVQIILLYNPLAHFMEMIHGFYFYALDDGFVDYKYMLVWTIVPLYFGLWFYKRLEERIISL
jgi:capsular polysaccharide transport system permease protein